MANIFYTMQKNSYDLTAIDVYNDLANSYFPTYKGRIYDKINLLNDKYRLYGDINKALQEARERV